MLMKGLASSLHQWEMCTDPKEVLQLLASFLTPCFSQILKDLLLFPHTYFESCDKLDAACVQSHNDEVQVITFCLW